MGVGDGGRWGGGERGRGRGREGEGESEGDTAGVLETFEHCKPDAVYWFNFCRDKGWECLAHHYHGQLTSMR